MHARPSAVRFQSIAAIGFLALTLTLASGCGFISRGFTILGDGITKLFSGGYDIEEATTYIATDIDEKMGNIEAKRITVASFTDKQNTVTELGREIAKRIETKLVNVMPKHGASIIERDRLDYVLNEIEFQLGDLSNQQQTVGIGNLVGADTLIVGELSEKDSYIYAQLKMVKVETGAVVYGAQVEIARTSDLDYQARKPVEDIVVGQEKVAKKVDATEAGSGSLVNAPEQVEVEKVERVELALEVAGYQFKDSDSTVTPMANGAKLKSGENFNFSFNTDRDAHIYIIYKDSSGAIALLYPQEGRAAQNGGIVKGGAWNTAPESGSAWKLDNNVGEETFWVIASIRPFEKATIDQIIAGNSKVVDLKKFEETVKTTERKVDIIMTLRGGVDALKKKESVPPGYFADSADFWAEGTQIDPKTGLPVLASAEGPRVTAERAVGINTVVKRFTIQHVE